MGANATPTPATYTAAGHKIVPAPNLGREVGPDEVWVEIDGVILPELCCALRTRFAAMDAAMAGMTEAEILAAVNRPDGGAGLLHPSNTAPADSDLAPAHQTDDDTPEIRQ